MPGVLSARAGLDIELAAAADNAWFPPPVLKNISKSTGLLFCAPNSTVIGTSPPTVAPTTASIITLMLHVGATACVIGWPPVVLLSFLQEAIQGPAHSNRIRTSESLFIVSPPVCMYKNSMFLSV